uniref:Uncharacterized protein n=1 Tax=Gallus gallus TaxID=9031 RepID=A0A8V0ZFU8_CHICK
STRFPQRSAHLQQLPLHLITDQVWGLPPLPTLQVVGCNCIGHLSGIECPFQPQLLSCQQVGLCIELFNCLLKLCLPEVDVLQPLAQGSCGILLGTLGGSFSSLGQLFSFIPVALRLLTAGKGLVVQVVVALVPLRGQILGSAELGGRHCLGCRFWPLVPGPGPW